MINDKSVLALIPARGGSKGIKNKNIKDFNGLPLIAHTINQAKDISYIDELIVSTDSDDIKDVAENFGAKVPFKRPKIISNDRASNIDVAIHAINKVKTDIIIILQPTSPLRGKNDIIKSLELLFKDRVKTVIGAYKIKNYAYSFSLDNSGFISNSASLQKLSTNRQSHKDHFTVNGAIYSSYTDYFLQIKSFFTSRTYVYQMPVSRSVDIDELDDWAFAEKLFYNK